MKNETKNNNDYQFSSAVLVTDEGMQVTVGCEYEEVSEPGWDEHVRNIEIMCDSRNIDYELISEELRSVYKPQDFFVDFNQPGEDKEYIRFQLFFDHNKMTDETMLNETLLDVIFFLHCFWHGKMTIENF